jgi:hypothetical protein
MKFKTKIDKFIVHPKPSNPFVIDKDGILVVCSELVESFADFLQKEREDRMKRVILRIFNFRY